MRRLLAPVALALLGALALAACGAAPANTPAPTNPPASTDAPAGAAGTDSPAPTAPPAGTNGPTGDAAAGAPLAGSAWLLETLGGQPPAPDTQITLGFEADTLAGSDGCNRYRGSYRTDGDTISVDENIVSTMMACPEPAMQQASAYLAALKQAATFKLEGERLTLLDAAGAPLATFVAQSSELSGTAWVVTGLNNGKQAVVSTLAGTELTLEFADGQLGGSAGCNAYTSTYEVAESSLTIGAVAATKKLCAEPAGVMDQEAQFLQALATAATYRVEGDKLEIRTADGALAVSATRAP
jgi:heat shock protein HslJ